MVDQNNLNSVFDSLAGKDEAEKSPEPAKQSTEPKAGVPRKPSHARKPDIRPSTSNPTPRIEPGRVESIGPQNLKNNITEAKKAGLQLGGAEGDKQKEESAKQAETPNPSVLTDKK